MKNRRGNHWTTGGNWIIYDVNDQQVYIYIFLEKKQLPRTRRKQKFTTKRSLTAFSLKHFTSMSMHTPKFSVVNSLQLTILFNYLLTYRYAYLEYAPSQLLSHFSITTSFTIPGNSPIVTCSSFDFLEPVQLIG